MRIFQNLCCVRPSSESEDLRTSSAADGTFSATTRIASGDSRILTSEFPTSTSGGFDDAKVEKKLPRLQKPFHETSLKDLSSYYAKLLPLLDQGFIILKSSSGGIISPEIQAKYKALFDIRAKYKTFQDRGTPSNLLIDDTYWDNVAGVLNWFKNLEFLGDLKDRLAQKLASPEDIEDIGEEGQLHIQHFNDLNLHTDDLLSVLRKAMPHIV